MYLRHGAVATKGCVGKHVHSQNDNPVEAIVPKWVFAYVKIQRYIIVSKNFGGT